MVRHVGILDCCGGTAASIEIHVFDLDGDERVWGGLDDIFNFGNGRVK